MPTIAINNIFCYYQKFGEGPAVVLIHGLGSSSLDWSPQIESLSRSYTVLVPDLYGHGQTVALPKLQSISDFADLVAGILDKEVDGPSHIIGLSLGGAVAFQLALMRPELVESLVITNSRADFRPIGWRAKTAVFSRQLVLRLLGMKVFSRALAKKLFPGSPHLQLVFTARFSKNRLSDYLQSLRTLLRWNIEPSLSAIKCPVLLVVSEFDYYPIDDTKAYIKMLDNARLVIIAGAHHAVTLENSTAFNKVILDHLNKQRSTDLASALGGLL